MTRFPFIAALMIWPAMAIAQAPEPDPCGALGFQGLIGQRAEIARMLALDNPMRVITPTTAVTRDYRLERINFDVDEDDIIRRISCG